MSLSKDDCKSNSTYDTTVGKDSNKSCDGDVSKMKLLVKKSMSLDLVKSEKSDSDVSVLMDITKQLMRVSRIRVERERHSPHKVRFYTNTRFDKRTSGFINSTNLEEFSQNPLTKSYVPCELEDIEKNSSKVQISVSESDESMGNDKLKKQKRRNKRRKKNRKNATNSQEKNSQVTLKKIIVKSKESTEYFPCKMSDVKLHSKSIQKTVTKTKKQKGCKASPDSTKLTNFGSLESSYFSPKTCEVSAKSVADNSDTANELHKVKTEKFIQERIEPRKMSPLRSILISTSRIALSKPVKSEFVLSKKKFKAADFETIHLSKLMPPEGKSQEGSIEPTEKKVIVLSSPETKSDYKSLFSQPAVSQPGKSFILPMNKEMDKESSNSTSLLGKEPSKGNGRCSPSTSAVFSAPLDLLDYLDMIEKGKDKDLKATRLCDETSGLFQAPIFDKELMNLICKMDCNPMRLKVTKENSSLKSILSNNPDIIKKSISSSGHNVKENIKSIKEKADTAGNENSSNEPFSALYSTLFELLEYHEKAIDNLKTVKLNKSNSGTASIEKETFKSKEYSSGSVACKLNKNVLNVKSESDSEKLIKVPSNQSILPKNPINRKESSSLMFTLSRDLVNDANNSYQINMNDIPLEPLPSLKSTNNLIREKYSTSVNNFKPMSKESQVKASETVSLDRIPSTDTSIILSRPSAELFELSKSVAVLVKSSPNKTTKSIIDKINIATDSKHNNVEVKSNPIQSLNKDCPETKIIEDSVTQTEPIQLEMIFRGPDDKIIIDRKKEIVPTLCEKKEGDLKKGDGAIVKSINEKSVLPDDHEPTKDILNQIDSKSCKDTLTKSDENKEVTQLIADTTAKSIPSPKSINTLEQSKPNNDSVKCIEISLMTKQECPKTLDKTSVKTNHTENSKISFLTNLSEKSLPVKDVQKDIEEKSMNMQTKNGSIEISFAFKSIKTDCGTPKLVEPCKNKVIETFPIDSLLKKPEPKKMNSLKSDSIEINLDLDNRSLDKKDSLNFVKLNGVSMAQISNSNSSRLSKTGERLRPSSLTFSKVKSVKSMDKQKNEFGMFKVNKTCGTLKLEISSELLVGKQGSPPNSEPVDPKSSAALKAESNSLIEKFKLPPISAPIVKLDKCIISSLNKKNLPQLSNELKDLIQIKSTDLKESENDLKDMKEIQKIGLFI